MIHNIINKKYITNLFSFSTQRLFLFAGQGTQQKGMLDKFFSNQSAHKIINHASNLLNINFEEIATKDSFNQINNTHITQPLLLLSHYLHFHYFFKESLKQQDYLIGHSLGQFSALTIAQSISLEDCLKLVKKRGQLMMKHTLQPNGMLIIKYKKDQKDIVMKEIQQLNLQISCFNTDTNIIVGGKTILISKLKQNLKTKKIGSLMLPVSTAFHSKMLQPMKPQFKQSIDKIQLKKPKCKIIKNYDSQIYLNEHQIKQGLLNQLCNPVMFSQSVRKVPNQIQFKQISHKNWISKFVEQIRSQVKTSI